MLTKKLIVVNDKKWQEMFLEIGGTGIDEERYKICDIDDLNIIAEYRGQGFVFCPWITGSDREKKFLKMIDLCSEYPKDDDCFDCDNRLKCLTGLPFKKYCRIFSGLGIAEK